VKHVGEEKGDETVQSRREKYVRAMGASRDWANLALIDGGEDPRSCKRGRREILVHLLRGTGAARTIAKVN